MRIAPFLAAGALAAFPAAARAENTPDGAATLISTYLSTAPAIVGEVGALSAGGYYGPRVVISWTVTVGAGGRAGTVRPKIGTVLGDPVELPAEPGTYTFRAPHVASTWPLGLVQSTGGHAIVTREACRPDAGRSADPCEYKWVDILRDGQPDERDRGAQLALTFNTEPDADSDLRGDLTEDHTDLRVSTKPSREADGRLRIEVTVTNAGPLAADLFSLDATPLAGARWEGACLPHSAFPHCLSTPLAAGESRVFVIRAEDPGATTATVTARSEGADLAAADNAGVASFAAAPSFDLVTAKEQRLSKGVKVQVRGVRAGPARVTVAFKVRGHTIKLARVVKLAPYTARTVTLHATGAKLRSLRRHAPLSAEISVRTPGTQDAVTAKTVIR
jgi:hypothetical protein